jgi:DNA-binding LacI/PurR family transcriptional regulator
LDNDAALPVRRATLVDVAERAKVSASAVSRTFTPGASVSKQMRSRVLKAAQELGFQPNVLARSLMTGRSDLIALVATAFHNPYVMSIIDVFTTELQARNLRPLVFNMKNMANWSDTINLILQYRIDGVLVASSTMDKDFLRAIHAARIPTVIAFGRSPEDCDIDSIFAGNIEGGRLAARELLRRGYRRLAFIGAPEHVTTSQDRLTGYRQYLSAQGLQHELEMAADYSHAAGMSAAERIFRRAPEIDAIFCADDQIAMGAMDALRFRLGRSVPDVGVVGFNDMEMAEWPAYDLATFRTNTEQLVVNAIDVLQIRMRNVNKASEQRIIKCQFVARSSVRSRLMDQT